MIMSYIGLTCRLLSANYTLLFAFALSQDAFLNGSYIGLCPRSSPAPQQNPKELKDPGFFSLPQLTLTELNIIFAPLQIKNLPVSFCISLFNR